MNQNTIVVGVDGSEHSLVAARWAATEAQRRDAALRVVLVYEYAWPGAQFDSPTILEARARELANTVIATAVAQAQMAAHGIKVSSSTVRGRPSEKLIEHAANAALLVVGSRGHGGFVNLLSGSTSMQVATHAHGPVAVVRGHASAVEGPVVVGVDGSPSSLEALEAGFEAAAKRNTELIAVRAYELPMVWSGYGIGPEYVNPETIEKEQHQHLNEEVATWQEKYPDVPVKTVVARGSAADVLIGVSKSAQLVVVGTRGHGGFTGLLLGSVGQQLMHHSQSPVLIVRR
jgi:nucleotide-binding universal stress UspA family protein